ncbi:hypothetical protein BIFGAL_02895 [Bifidobacterium gallicum DSM 20093 = LMG 11596]|uniref:Uncharacterized protein n=1 Tax=Bifidobacterium gallicum DSM 20093 = LMG 11596 TaxID=561180 RepID=D1NSY4_9BIFI|nr:hypothetical protein BIFGAL_02895 [Bifidobacterium gallicum DSM 20093 = LMG 11596]
MFAVRGFVALAVTSYHCSRRHPWRGSMRSMQAVSLGAHVVTGV